jgi:hypothetical protein
MCVVLISKSNAGKLDHKSDTSSGIQEFFLTSDRFAINNTPFYNSHVTYHTFTKKKSRFLHVSVESGLDYSLI